ncbi:hypothetical protein OZN62_01480 [Aurantiacibacter sp. MUD11]|uniref:hypothetical protein n=1 Tax=Aurantiacibacter sp. MUD11 TaxID=3003265 RepID=UPI0022AAEB11|nr:hypothetical protein [Aurantiacibacter sp. MUD11]WAT18274.1 hypothetical protein OZN62_01480 [Aurantiacibacter sp. MUD11]
MKFHILAAATIIVGSSVAWAQDTGDEDQRQEATTVAQNQEEEAEEDDPSQEVVCRTERVTGSLTRRRRICMTRSEWDDVEAATRQGLSQMRGSGAKQCPPGDPMGGC